MAKSKVTEVRAAAPPRGVYHVRLAPYPRKPVDTGLPAGPAAEAVARDRYLAWLGLEPRAGQEVEVELVE